MNATTTQHRSRRHRAAAVALAVAGLLGAATACSSTDEAATATPRPAPATTPAPSSTASPAPPSTVSPAPPSSASPAETAAAAARRASLTAILASHRAAGDFVGARIALRDSDGTVTEVGDGTTTLDPASPPVDPDVPWNVGSVTKTFVAVVVLQLAEEGRIDLDAGIASYLPDLAGGDRITPRQLLQHTSGLGEYNDKPAVLDDMQRAWTPAELIAVAEAGGRVGEPGGAHHYANTNYIVLGEIIEQVTGHPWADEVRDRIVEPLGLTHTSLITTERTPGFKSVDGAFVDVTASADPSVGGAAGALQSTDRDLLAFATALMQGRLLSPASQAAMQSFVPAEDLSQYGIVHGYGLGLERYEMGPTTVLCHMGTGETGSAYFGFDPGRGTAVAVVTNTANSGPQAIMGVEALTAAAAGA
jgi:D-alanyl-D-alanine carboxypeptidase